VDAVIRAFLLGDIGRLIDCVAELERKIKGIQGIANPVFDGVLKLA
jgi:hypothetical protein